MHRLVNDIAGFAYLELVSQFSYLYFQIVIMSDLLFQSWETDDVCIKSLRWIKQDTISQSHMTWDGVIVEVVYHCEQVCCSSTHICKDDYMLHTQEQNLTEKIL